MDGPIKENEKYQILNYFRCGGGPAFNSSYVCGKWGADTSFLTQIGGDQNGQYLKEVLQKGNVNMDFIIENPDLQTPYSYIFTNAENGARTLFNFPGNVTVPPFTFPDEDIDVILSDGHEPELSIEAIKKYPNAISIVDAGGYRECTMAVAKEVDYLVCSEYFASQHSGLSIDPNNWDSCEQAMASMEKINGKYAVITLGEKGLIYREDGEVKHLSAYQVKAVDTTGAGDIFHGAFAYGIHKRMSLIDILKMSSMASAISVQFPGGNTSIPDLKTVEEALCNN